MHYNTLMLNLLWVLSLGWMLGGVVNYLSDVLPHSRRLSFPICHACQEERSWYAVFWPGGCQACGAKPAVRHWLVQNVSVLMLISLWFYPPDRLGFIGAVIWGTYFLIVVVIDVEHRLILHPISMVGAVMGIAYGVYMHGIWSTLLGGIAGFGAMLFLYYLGALFLKILIRIRGEETDEVPLGFGDVNLAGVIGLLLGWPGITAGLLLAILIGGVVSLIYLLVMLAMKRYQAYTALPYGPFLVASAVILLFFT